MKPWVKVCSVAVAIAGTAFGSFQAGYQQRAVPSSTPRYTITATALAAQTAKPTFTPIPTAKPTEKAAKNTEILVWIPKSGHKYHKKSTCSNMKNPKQVTLEVAIAAGFEKCKKCWK